MDRKAPTKFFRAVFPLARLRCVRSRIVVDVFREQALEMLFLYRNDVIQPVYPTAFDPTLGNAVGLRIQLRRIAMLRFDVSE